MIAFSLIKSSNGEKIAIDIDAKGIDELIEVLQDLKLDDGGHVHLMAGSGPGLTLSCKTPTGKEAILEVVISQDD